MRLRNNVKISCFIQVKSFIRKNVYFLFEHLIVKHIFAQCWISVLLQMQF